MNILFRLVALVCLILSIPSAAAFTYQDGNLLLIFRRDPANNVKFNDVEFNLGSISNYLGLANGTIISVTNWDKNLVLSNYGNSFSGVKFILLAATGPILPAVSRRVWISNADPATTPLDVTGSKIAEFISKISGVANDAAASTTNSSTQTHVVASDDPSSYTDHIGEGGLYDLATLGGSAAFVVEQGIPGNSRFFNLKPSSVTPKPAAALIGSFAMTAGGGLTFTADNGVVAAPPRPAITGISRLGDVNTISFTTTNAATYRLRYSSTLGTTVTNWTILSTTVTGNGATLSLQDTTSALRFYAVEALP